MTSEFNIAIHALAFLNHRQCTVASEALAANICTNPARVRKVMARLKQAGLVETHAGAEGGYRFTRKASEVTLREIGSAVSAQYVGAVWHSGDTHKECLVASGMAGMMDEVYAELNALCAEHLAHITLADVDARLFDKRG